GGIIDIRHNWIDREGLKSPKCGSFRKVPYGAAVSACLDAVRATARHIGGADFVLESLFNDGEPVSKNFFVKGLWAALADTGLSVEAQKRRNITPHSLRHSFISLARLAGVDDLTVQTLAGHSDIAMTDHYTHAAQAMDYEAVRAKFRLIA
ncbi:tyrosine-type recombinase/integrase, partial [Treponema endosymbiont of Eucomonympha sp.]|uniref:tyrosine-type recombinase/integrase n=2 Tax=Treponema endosymbiont of Eucomonympha sp. TaxID=1580831 RepID=UPI000A910658